MRRIWWAIPLLGILELALHFVFASRAPSSADWQQLTEQLRALRRENEPLVIAPHWAEPNARHHMGDALMPLREVARPDVSRYPSVLEISALGQHSDELNGFTLAAEFAIGPFSVRRLDNPTPQLVHFDFVDELGPSRTRVSQERGASERECEWITNGKVTNGALFGHATFPRERFRCPGGDWAMVGATVIDDQDYRPRRCLWAQPGEKRSLRLQYEDVEIGERLQGHAGNSYFFSREQHGPPVVLEAWVRETKIGEFQYRDGDGWKGFSFDTVAWRGQRHPVRFRISSRKAKRREFCFQADTRSAAAPSSDALGATHDAVDIPGRRP